MDHSMHGSSSGSDSNSMNMSGGSMDTMDSMTMTFQNSHSTPLFSTGWTPTSNGTYAGTCIFLIVLGIIWRLLLAAKAVMEQRFAAAARERRYIVNAGQMPEAERIKNDPDASQGTLVTAHGVEERVRVVQRSSEGPIPWRFSTDLPRAVLVTCTIGVGYLLMLAVMTMNVGYFMSSLAGVFIGELAVGRYIQILEHH